MEGFKIKKFSAGLAGVLFWYFYPKNAKLLSSVSGIYFEHYTLHQLYVTIVIIVRISNAQSTDSRNSLNDNGRGLRQEISLFFF